MWWIKKALFLTVVFSFIAITQASTLINQPSYCDLETTLEYSLELEDDEKEGELEKDRVDQLLLKSSFSFLFAISFQSCFTDPKQYPIKLSVVLFKPPILLA